MLWIDLDDHPMCYEDLRDIESGFGHNQILYRVVAALIDLEVRRFSPNNFTITQGMEAMFSPTVIH